MRSIASLRQLDAVERLRRGRGSFRAPGPGRPAADCSFPFLRPDVVVDGQRAVGREGDQIPAHARAVVGHRHGGEHVSAERMIRLVDHDRHVEQWDEALTDEEPVFLAADEHGDLARALDRLVCRFHPRRKRFGRVCRRRRLVEVVGGRRELIAFGSAVTGGVLAGSLDGGVSTELRWSGAASSAEACSARAGCSAAVASPAASGVAACATAMNRPSAQPLVGEIHRDEARPA